MPTLKEIKKSLETISTIKNVASTYQEIANLRMKKNREKALKNRVFFKELLAVYQKIKLAYLALEKIKTEHLFSVKKEKYPLKATKEKVAIFLSANHFFYGPLILDIWSKVVAYLKNNEADLVVVGRVGKYLVEISDFKKKMFYFDLEEEKPEEKNVEPIIRFLKNYKKVIVFYGRYKTVLVQEAIASEISELPFEKKDEKIKTYLFEPSPEALLEFFETEIVATLFNQCILEHQLALFSSRLIAMYRATENAKKIEHKLATIEKKLKKQILNKKQIELFAPLEILKLK